MLNLVASILFSQPRTKVCTISYRCMCVNPRVYRYHWFCQCYTIFMIHVSSHSTLESTWVSSDHQAVEFIEAMMVIFNHFCSCTVCTCRHRQLKDQYESVGHEMEMVKTRMEQSTHHQQLTHLQQLRDNIGKQSTVP